VRGTLPGIFLAAMHLPGLPRRRRRSDVDHTVAGRSVPDPGQVPTARGSWEEAALTNVDITELVKRQIRTVTRPWEK
jgi:hypothetical protein